MKPGGSMTNSQETFKYPRSSVQTLYLLTLKSIPLKSISTPSRHLPLLSKSRGEVGEMSSGLILTEKKNPTYSYACNWESLSNILNG